MLDWGLMNSKEQDPKQVPAPRLRFPGFTGEWEERKLGELGQTLGGLTGKAGADFGSGKPFVTYKQVFDHSTVDFSKCGLVKVEAGEKQTILKLGDILVTMSSETPEEVGFTSVVSRQPKEEIYLNSFCFLLRPKDKRIIDTDFSKHLFHSPAYRKAVVVLAQGVTRFNISKNRFLDLKLPLPPTLPEQTRIAAALSSLDAVIAAHQSKQDALREHKRGLMAGLFPIEGERVPRLRFPEFEGAGEWEEKKLGELGTFRGGGTPDKAISEYWSGNIPWISSSDINEDDIRTVSFTRFITEGAVKNSATKKIPARSVLFVSRVGVGKLAVNTQELCTSQDFINLHPEYDNEYFIAYYFKSKANLLISFGQGMAIKGFTKNDLESIVLPLPSLSEQTRIAATLSSLDDLIAAQSDKIAALQEFKWGLMQGLFPNTGAGGDS